MREAIEYIGIDNLEDRAVQEHYPAPAIYIYVNTNGKDTKIIRNEKRVEFNSKYKMMDYYSGLVSMQKPIKSKLILSNNWMSFFCRNVEKLKNSEIDEYFERTGLPEKYNWYKEYIKDNIRNIKKAKKDVVKFFLLEEPELYRKYGLENWTEKSISEKNIPREQKGKGYPIGCTYNVKKPYTFSRMYLVEKEEGLQIKFFYDILKGLKCRGYSMLVVADGIFLPLRNGETPNIKIKGGIILAFGIKNGVAYIEHMDTITNYSPNL